MNLGALDGLIWQTRKRFPDLDHAPGEILTLEKGGSERQYYRIRFNTDRSLILVKYNREKPENARFVGIADFLCDIGVNAPVIFHHDSEEGLIWMQDLGEADLWHHRTDPWPIRRRLYESALDQAIILHNSDADVSNLDLQSGFDERLYRWEQEYCFENCLGRYFQVGQREVDWLRSHPAFTSLAEKLASYPKRLVHRDFQSQNVLLYDQRIYLIDFQGMRPGLPQYDLASLFLDPYVSLTNEERSHLLSYYFEKNSMGCSRSEFEQIYYYCGIQRLMQALGAYGVIGMLAKKREFLRHIEPAIKTLIEVASVTENFIFFADFLAGLPVRPKPSI
jgi:aminoglycoside/choline kinase family phosphotransferase